MSDIAFTLIQTNLHWEDKTANFQMFEEKIDAIKKGTHVTILPEMFTTGFSMQPEKLAEHMGGPALQWMENLSAKHNCIITGSLIIKENNQYFNRLIWMPPNGQLEYYDKRHLFAFAKEDEHYTAGKTQKKIETNGWKINIQVCYDLRFPVWARQPRDDKYDVLLYVANWPERRIHAWKTLLMARAIENQCYVVAVNRVGNDGNGIYHNGCSMVIDPLGEILYQKEHEEDVFTITLKKNLLEEVRTKFPFWKDADDFEIQD